MKKILLSPESNIPNHSNASSTHEGVVYKPGGNKEKNVNV